mmetsp:Transcript_9729/g.36181  ORF Transcript_9729/g.36181 Transcript_9729/m.36181 type:complete len:961 (-) Transcript_9729:1206-4088(-)|eukprot:CAMPEP_0117448366 /NCGR_PEP_ID=MMETSP0759-20121206/7361_1 /TAXON_ID=63605 /ORGANISM="Percolomonas cosmopolitus, Strain WS" /LENGTH=960 /DNA_ID=CAMNT_0005240745 /DNA_START=204 /DNA_END=3086 /DNA_ORIENTATION=-
MTSSDSPTNPPTISPPSTTQSANQATKQSPSQSNPTHDSTQSHQQQETPSETPFDPATLETLHFLKHTHPATAPLLREHKISVAIVLGTGLGPFIDGLKGKISVPYTEIPNMPQCTIQGHSGHIVIGYFESEGDTKERHYCIVYAGRVHAYEGISYHEVCFQVKLSAALGCQKYILTNSTGGLQDGMYEGCLFLIKDHIRFIGRTDPLFEMRYASQWKVQDTQEYWDEEFQNVARTCASRLGIELFEGAYVYASGPTYETPLEVQTAIKAGGGVVGMSTVAEVIAANAYGMKVLGVSMVTNLGAGISTKMLTHNEVQENAAQAIPRFILLLQEVVREMPMCSGEERKQEDTVSQEHDWEMHEKGLEKKSLDTKNLSKNLPETLKYLRSHLNIDEENLSSIMFIASDKTLVESIVDSTSVLLRDIPHFPYVSIAGNFGTMHYGSMDSCKAPGCKKSIVVRTANREGFNEEEAAFLAILAWKMGVCKLVHTVQGEHIEDESSEKKDTKQEKAKKYPPFTLIDDFLNFSASTRPLAVMKSIIDKPLSNVSTEPLMVHNAAHSVRESVSTNGDSSRTNDSEKQVYLSFQAPSTASLSEEKMGRLFGATIIGRTNLSPLYAFRYLGMDVCAVRTSAHSDQERAYVEYMHQFVLNEAKEMASAIRKDREEIPLRDKPLAISASSTQAASRITYEQVAQAAEFVRQQIGAQTQTESGKDTKPIPLSKHAILDLELNLQWPKERVVKSVPLASVPNVPSTFVNDALRALNLDLLTFGSGDNITNVFSICGCFDGHEPFYLADASFFMRLFQELGVREVILATTLRNADPEAPFSAVYSLKDHINFTGENPLIGRNIPQWGPRFPDASTVYSLPFTAPDGVEKRAVNCLFTSTNRLLRLTAEEDLARRLNCQVLGNLAIREMITSTHCKANSRIRVGCLGLLEGYDQVKERNLVEDLQKIIYAFFESEQ